MDVKVISSPLGDSAVGVRQRFNRKIQGNPATVFCKISVRRSKDCLEFSINLGRLKISR